MRTAKELREAALKAIRNSPEFVEVMCKIRDAAIEGELSVDLRKEIMTPNVKYALFDDGYELEQLYDKTGKMLVAGPTRVSWGRQ